MNTDVANTCHTYACIHAKLWKRTCQVKQEGNANGTLTGSEHIRTVTLCGTRGREHTVGTRPLFLCPFTRETSPHRFHRNTESSSLSHQPSSEVNFDKSLSHSRGKLSMSVWMLATRVPGTPSPTVADGITCRVTLAFSFFERPIEGH